jgi:hypothetical protein
LRTEALREDQALCRKTAVTPTRPQPLSAAITADDGKDLAGDMAEGSGAIG